jgi:hypothetical protein
MGAMGRGQIFFSLKDNFLKNGGLIFAQNNEKSNGYGVLARL